MYYASSIIETAGLLLLIFGYRKINRNLMLAGALLVFCGAHVEAFAGGYMDGWQHKSTPAGKPSIPEK